MNIRNSTRLLACGAILAALTGCVSTPAISYQPSIANSERLLSYQGKTAVGQFSAADGVENRRLSVRGSTLNGGSDGTFSTYLKEALSTELREGGKLQPMAATVVSGKLVENRLNAAGVKQGTATIAAEFVVTRGGATIYSRTIRVDNSWESSFIGAVAIPAAISGYTATVQKLMGGLFADADFRAATQDGAVAK